MEVAQPLSLRWESEVTSLVAVFASGVAVDTVLGTDPG